MVGDRSCGTHDGVFHADEVTACALLVMSGQIDRQHIIRTRDESRLSSCGYLCDVGGIYDPTKLRFDHHQAEYQGPLSSAGMVLLHLEKSGFISGEFAAYLREELILGVDLHDNGKLMFPIGSMSFSQLIFHFNPPSYEVSDEVRNHEFDRALDFVLSLLFRLKERFDLIQETKQLVLVAMNVTKPYLLFDRPLPWMENFFALGGECHPALFVVMPSREAWKVRAIPPTLTEKMGVRHPLPASWAGLLGEELCRVSGIEGAIFCHKERFISVWSSKESAMKALEIALKTQNSG